MGRIQITFNETTNKTYITCSFRRANEDDEEYYYDVDAETPYFLMVAYGPGVLSNHYKCVEIYDEQVKFLAKSLPLNSADRLVETSFYCLLFSLSWLGLTLFILY
jgi:hypothetical protein